MKCLAVGGPPASGKTSLMRRVVKELGPGKLKKTGLLVYQEHPSSKCLVLGSYVKSGFAGTDILSMAVQPIALGVMQAWASSRELEDWTVLFEGDRLFNTSFLNDLVKIDNLDYYWIMLDASAEAQDKRHKERRDTQSEKWLKGRKTKAERLRNSLEGVVVLKNETKEDLESNVNSILDMIGLKDECNSIERRKLP